MILSRISLTGGRLLTDAQNSAIFCTETSSTGAGGIRFGTRGRSVAIRFGAAAAVSPSESGILGSDSFSDVSISVPASLGEVKRVDLKSAFLLFSALIAATFAVILSRKPEKNVQKKLPPGPTGLPILGSLLTIGSRPYESLSKLAKIYGPLMTVNFGMVKIVIVSSAEMAEEIFLKHDEAFSGRPSPEAVTAEEDYELSLVWSSGQSPLWKKLRKICNTELFTAQRLASSQSVRDETVRNMIKQVRESMQKGEAVQLGKLVFSTMLSILSKTLFSGDMFEEAAELKELINDLIELVGKPNLADFIPFLKPFDPQGIRSGLKVLYKRFRRVLDDITAKRVESRGQGSSKNGDFLDVLLDYSEEHGSGELSSQNISILLMDLFLGGTHTTTTLTEWTMAELLCNPPVRAELKSQLRLKIPSGEPVLDSDIPQVPYIVAVIKESLRLHPVAPLLVPHRAEQQVVIDGYTIPKHTQVFVNAWDILRDPNHWEDPVEFRPERFTSQDAGLRGRDFRYIPFGSGRRVCPGSNLSIRVVSLMVANLVHWFDWEVMKGEEVDMGEGFGMTLYKRQPLVLVPVNPKI